MDYGDVHRLFQRLRQRTGIDVIPYMFRHTSLSRLAKVMKPAELQARAGHKSYLTTSRYYVQIEQEDLREAFAKGRALVQARSCGEGDQ